MHASNGGGADRHRRKKNLLAGETRPGARRGVAWSVTGEHGSWLRLAGTKNAEIAVPGAGPGGEAGIGLAPRFSRREGRPDPRTSAHVEKVEQLLSRSVDSRSTPCTMPSSRPSKRTASTSHPAERLTSEDRKRVDVRAGPAASRRFDVAASHSHDDCQKEVESTHQDQPDAQQPGQHDGAAHGRAEQDHTGDDAE